MTTSKAFDWLIVLALGAFVLLLSLGAGHDIVNNAVYEVTRAGAIARAQQETVMRHLAAGDRWEITQPITVTTLTLTLTDDEAEHFQRFCGWWQQQDAKRRIEMRKATGTEHQWICGPEDQEHRK